MHHATADNNVNIAALVELIARHVGLPNVTLERLERFDGKRASAIEKLLLRATAYYNSITSTTKHFEKNDGTRWILGMDEVERYVIEGVRAFESVESQLPDRQGDCRYGGPAFRWNVYANGKMTAEPRGSSMLPACRRTFSLLALRNLHRVG